MRSTRILTVFILLLLTLPVFCQETHHSFIPDTIYVSADGKFETDPDTAVVQFNIGTQEKQLKDAYAKARRAADQIRDILKANGIDPSAAQVSHLQVSPLYDYKGGGKRKAVAYRVSSAVSIKLKDFDRVAPIADAFGEIDVTEQQSINYILEDAGAAKAKAVEDATRRAKANAETAAKVGGRQLGSLMQASVDTNLQLVALPRGRSFDSIVEFAPGARKEELSRDKAPTEEFSAERITITATVTALFSLK
jgi:uncharacterized protein YggE